MFFGIDDIFHFSTDGRGFNTIKNNNDQHILGEVETVTVLLKEGRVLVLTRDSHESDYLYGFDLDGNLIFKVTPPEHYNFWYLSRKQIACYEADALEKKSPRSGWWFSIDLDNGKMIMGAPAY